jgi:hypothetical protein
MENLQWKKGVVLTSQRMPVANFLPMSRMENDRK